MNKIINKLKKLWLIIFNCVYTYIYTLKTFNLAQIYSPLSTRTIAVCYCCNGYLTQQHLQPRFWVMFFTVSITTKTSAAFFTDLTQPNRATNITSQYTHLIQLFENWIPFRIGKQTGSDLHQRYTQRPDITTYIVALSALGINAFRLSKKIFYKIS